MSGRRALRLFIYMYLIILQLIILGHLLLRTRVRAYVYLVCTYFVPGVYPDFGECVSGYYDSFADEQQALSRRAGVCVRV